VQIEKPGDGPGSRRRFGRRGHPDQTAGVSPEVADEAVPLFSLDAVRLAGREGRVRLDDLTVDIPDRAVTVVVGPSGSGKSSLLRLCNRLEAPDAGSVSFRGHDLDDLDPRALRRRVGMLFQQPVTFPGTGRDNLREAAPEASDDRMVRWLDQADLDRSFLDRVADELSGGQAQRLCLARALATEPEVLLADEATSALDRSATAAIEMLVARLDDGGIPVVWVTHDLEQARRLADHVIVVRDRTVVYDGPADRFDEDVPEGLTALLDERPEGDDDDVR
jgi:putative ABC transport system ATP-binding protein